MASDGIAVRPTSTHDQVATLFGRTMALVALTAGASALGAYLGRNVAYQWGWLFHRLPGVSGSPATTR